MSEYHATLALTFAWSEGRHMAPASGSTLPTSEGLTQMFFGLSILYAESLSLTEDRHGSLRTRHDSDRERIHEHWRALIRRRFIIPSKSGRAPAAADWPDRAPMPSIAPADELRIEALVMASPLELILNVPVTALAASGALGFFKLVHAIENAWNAPGRVRLEKAELDRDYWEAQLARERRRREYVNFTGGGFELANGSARLPEGWDWPEDPR